MTRRSDGPTVSDGATGRNRPTASDGSGSRDGDGAWTQVAQRNYDPDLDEELTTTIAFALAAAEDVQPIDLKAPPLYEVVDASALQDTLFENGNGQADRRGSGTVEFYYGEYRVEVGSDGWVQVYESTNGEQA